MSTAQHIEMQPVTLAGGFRHDRRIAALIGRACRRYDRWFGVRLPVPTITILTNRRQISQYWKRPQPTWLVGWYRRQNIYVLDRKIAKRTARAWDQLVIHECAHRYINLATSGCAPRWLNEGLACYLAGQRRRTRWTEVGQFFHRRTFNRSTDVYRIGYLVVSTLIRRYGRGRMLRFLNALRSTTPTRWGNAFARVYGIRWTQWLNLYASSKTR